MCIKKDVTSIIPLRITGAIIREMYCIVKKRAVLKKNLILDRFTLERKLPKRYGRTLKSGQRKPNLDESKTSFVSPNKHTEMYLLGRKEV